METTTPNAAATFVECRALCDVLLPVMDWYQSDEHEQRPFLDIVRDIVSDLQHDRNVAVMAGSAARDALELCHQIERCGCSEELTKASIMASDLRSKLASANTEVRQPETKPTTQSDQ